MDFLNRKLVDATEDEKKASFPGLCFSLRSYLSHYSAILHSNIAFIAMKSFLRKHQLLLQHWH